VLIQNAFDLIDVLGALSYQMLPEVGELPNLGIGGIGWKNATDAVGTLTALEPLTVVPKKYAEGVCIAFVGLVHSGVIGLDDNDFRTTALLEFGKEPVVEATDFDDCHVAAMFACLLGKGNEKFVNVSMIGTDLSFLHDFSLFVPDIDGQMLFVLVDA